MSPFTGAWLAFLVSQAGAANVNEALQAGDYVAALEIAETAEGVIGWRGRCEVFYSGGDPAAALAAARKGLALFPEDLPLLFRAAGAALWIQEGAGAREYLRRLEEAIPRARLGAEEEAGWRRAVRDLAERELEQERHALELTRSVSRTRGLSIASLVAATAFAFWMGTRGYGRSSNPVS